MNSSMVKKVNLTCFHFRSVELAPPYQVFDVDIQLSCSLLTALLDVTEVLLSGLPIRRTLFKAISECSEYLVWWLTILSWHLFLQGLPFISCLSAPKREWCQLLPPPWCEPLCSTASSSWWNVPMLQTCPQHANPSWEACPVVLECWPSFPLCYCGYFTFGRVWWSWNEKVYREALNVSNGSTLGQGSHFFPRTKFPDFSSIFFIFPWLLLNIFMAFISLLVLWLLFFQWPPLTIW